MQIERLNKKKEVIFEEHSKDYVIAKQKIISKFRYRDNIKHKKYTYGYILTYYAYLKY